MTARLNEMIMAWRFKTIGLEVLTFQEFSQKPSLPKGFSGCPIRKMFKAYTTYLENILPIYLLEKPETQKWINHQNPCDFQLEPEEYPDGTCC